MSSKPARKPEPNALSPLDTEPLTTAEKRRLNFLGYKAADIETLSVEDARARIETKRRNPGSKAFLAQATNPLTGTPGSPLPAALSNEEIERRNAGKESPVLLTLDEWEGRGMQAEGLLFDQLDKAYREQFPEHVFRWLHESICGKLGTDGFQEVRGPDGKRVMCADHWLGFKPRAVQQQQDRKLQEEINAPFRAAEERERSERPTGSARDFEVFQESTVNRGDERPHYIPLA